MQSITSADDINLHWYVVLSKERVRHMNVRYRLSVAKRNYAYVIIRTAETELRKDNSSFS